MVDGIDGQQLPKGSGTRMVSTITDFRSAALEETGRKQDYAIVGDGFFALYDPDTGEISYTRDGSFALSSFQQTKEDGTTDTLYYLADGEGRQVLDTNGYPIVVTDAEARQPVGVFTIQYLDGLQPVSYTHLDVYKRQRMGRPLSWQRDRTSWPDALCARRRSITLPLLRMYRWPGRCMPRRS